MRRLLMLPLLGLIASAATAEAQAPRGLTETRPPVPEVGVRGAYDFDGRDFGLGAQAQVPIGRVLRLAPSGDVYFGDRTTWQLNGDVAASLRFLRAGVGVALVDGARFGAPDDGIDVGLNLFAGVQAPPLAGQRMRPFAEARWTFLDHGTPVRFAAGVNVPIGGQR